MSDLLRDRRCRLLVGSRVYESAGGPGGDGLRVTFTVERSTQRQPNTAQIDVYNLGRDAGETLVRGASVQLVAGYAATAEVIFAGEIIRTVVDRSSPPDSVHSIVCADGLTAWRRSISTSLRGARPLRDVVREVASSMGLTVRPETLAQISGTSRRGVVLRGQASEALETVLRSAGYEWSVQDGALQVLRTGAATAEVASVLSPDSGLVGSPERLYRSVGTREIADGWRVVSLMQPRIRPGRRVRVESRDVIGTFRARRVVHEGDSHEASPWTTTVELSG